MGEEDMSIPTKLILSLAAALGGGITKKYYTDQETTKLSGGFWFNAVSCLTAAVVLLCWGGFGSASAFTVLLGVVFGAITALQGITNIAALQVGPMSYTSVIISFSTLISALSGVLFFDESLGWAQIVGIVLMLVSFILAAKSDSGEKKANVKWLFLCLIAEESRTHTVFTCKYPHLFQKKHSQYPILHRVFSSHLHDICWLKTAKHPSAE